MMLKKSCPIYHALVMTTAGADQLFQLMTQHPDNTVLRDKDEITLNLLFFSFTLTAMNDMFA